jgi:DNA replication protein DnaC
MGKEKKIYSHTCQDCRQKAEAEKQRLQEEADRMLLAQHRERWRLTCGIPRELQQTRTFEAFDRSLQIKSYDMAKKWVDGLLKSGARGYRSLGFYSDVPGVGKTHLMVAIANVILQEWQLGEDSLRSRRPGSPVKFISGPGLVRRIHATYDSVAGHEREDDVYADLIGVPVLMVDDIGKETPSPHKKEVYWYIVDERLKSGLPIVMSTRLLLQGPELEGVMGEDTVDRLFGMMRGQLITMTSTSYRRLKGVA